MRVLLIESDLDDAGFLKEALTELEERRYSQTWMQAEITHAVDLGEALAVLASEDFDVILLDPNLPDISPLQCFHDLSAAAPRIPIIVLAGPEEEPLAARLIREGAQDFLLKTEVDCAPLARSIRNAIERHRVFAALRSSAFIDDLTRAYNPAGFCALAEQNLKLAARVADQVLLVTADLLSYGSEDLDLILIEVADRLRHAAGDSSLIGRLGECRFGILVFDTGDGEANSTLNRLERTATSFSARGHVSISLGISNFDSTHPALLEALFETNAPQPASA